MKFNLPHPRSKKCLKKNMPKWKVVLWLKYHMCIEHQDLRAHIRIQGSMYGEHRPKASGEKEVIRAAVPQETKTWAPCPLLPWSTITHLSCVCVHIQSCPTLCNPTDCSPPGSSVHGILQVGILEWIAIPFTRGSSLPRDWTRVSYIAGRFFTEPPGKPKVHPSSVQFSSATQLCQILCNPMDCSMPSLPVHHQLPEFTQTHVHWVGDAIQPSHPLSSPSLPAFNLSQHQGLFQ